jgi:hypothetical protein
MNTPLKPADVAIIGGRPQGFAPTVIFQSFFRRGDPRGLPLQDFTLVQL